MQGRASLVEEEAEKVRALELLCGRLTPSMAETQNAYIRASLSKVAVIRLEIREITGKRNRAVDETMGGAEGWHQNRSGKSRLYRR